MNAAPRSSRALQNVRAGVGVAASGSLVDAQTVAQYLGVHVSWIYEHADELGARRLGSGPKARLRFSLLEVDDRLTSCVAARESGVDGSRTIERRSRRRRSANSGSTVPLLPVRGSEGAS